MKFNPTRSGQKVNNNYTRCLKLLNLFLFVLIPFSGFKISLKYDPVQFM